MNELKRKEKNIQPGMGKANNRKTFKIYIDSYHISNNNNNTAS